MKIIVIGAGIAGLAAARALKSKGHDVVMVAQGECQTLLLDYQRFYRFLLACPESCVSLLKSTVQRLVSSNQQQPRGMPAPG